MRYQCAADGSSGAKRYRRNTLRLRLRAVAAAAVDATAAALATTVAAASVASTLATASLATMVLECVHCEWNRYE